MFICRFACGRWLGRGVDDGSTERLLVGQLVPRTVDSEELVEACRTPPRSVSPSVHRPEIRPSDIQHLLGDCVNAIVKWHYRPNRERDTGSLTNLLCGEDGLVKCMESAFLYGFKSQRLFGRNFYIWDFLGMTFLIFSNVHFKNIEHFFHNSFIFYSKFFLLEIKFFGFEIMLKSSKINSEIPDFVFSYLN